MAKTAQCDGPGARAPADDRPAVAPSILLRVRGAAVAALCWGMLLTAAMFISPRGEGYGSHQDLGLPGCSMLMRTGYPCPSCGMTTSVSAVLHGQIGLAARSQPFGLLLVPAVGLLGLAGAAEAATGRDTLRRLRPGLWWVWLGIGGMLAGWGINLAAGMASGRWPAHL
jgi:hypothetical protein